MKNIIFILVLLAVQIATASEVVNFSGTWYGQGTLVSDTNKQGFYCEFDLVVNQAQDKIEFGKFQYTCDGYAFVFTPPTLTIRNGNEVFWNEQHVGNLEATKTKLTFHRPNKSTPTYTAEMLDKDTVEYEDAQIYTDGYQILNSTLYRVKASKK